MDREKCFRTNKLNLPAYVYTGRMGEQQAVACDQPHERFSLFVAKRY